MGLAESELLTLHRTYCIHTSMNDRKMKLFISYIYSQYSLRESSNFQPSCMNISFFPLNKASKLAWILCGTRGDYAGIFVQVAGNFLKKREDGHARCMTFAAFTWRSIFLRKFCAWNYRYLCVAGKVVWITHESCMCLAWKVVFSAHLPALRMQRKIGTFPQAVLYILHFVFILFLFHICKVPCKSCKRSSKENLKRPKPT